MGKTKLKKTSSSRPKPGQAVAAQPKRLKVTGKQLRQLDVVSDSTLSRIQGEIDMVSSPDERFSTFLYNTSSGRTATFAMATDDSDDTRLREEGAAVFRAELDQAFRDANGLQTNLPESLSISTANTDKQKNNAREAMISVIDGINKAQPPGLQYELSAPTVEAAGRTGAVLTFTIRPVQRGANVMGTAAPANQAPQGTTQAPPPDPISAANLPLQVFPALIRPGIFQQEMGGGFPAFRSREYQRLLKELEAYGKILTEYRSTFRNKPDTLAAFNDAVNKLEAQHAKLVQAAADYQQKQGKSANKVETVDRLLRDLGGPETAALRLKTAFRGVPFAHRLGESLDPLNPGANQDSVVYLARTNLPIGASNTSLGYAKKEGKTGDPENETAYQVGFSSDGEKLTEAPNLIVRQVMSSRLDKALGFGLIADEVFSMDEDGGLIGITAQATGTQAMASTKDGKQIHHRFDFRDPAIQKGFADLQLLDAITGQGDRHMGNVFIDRGTKKITGIDNDMSFPKDKDFISTSPNSLTIFDTQPDGSLTYKGDLIDVNTAKRVMAMTEEQFRTVLRGSEGDPRTLEPAAIEAAIRRLRAVKARIQELDQRGELVAVWGEGTYAKAMASPSDERLKVYSSLLKRAQVSYDLAGRPEADNVKSRGL